MTCTQTTIEDMCNAVSWLIRRRRRVNDRDVVEESAVVIVVVAVGIGCVVCGAVIVIVSVCGIRKYADVVLWLPLLLLMQFSGLKINLVEPAVIDAAATGCYSFDNHHRNGPVIVRIGVGVHAS